MKKQDITNTDKRTTTHRFVVRLAIQFVDERKTTVTYDPPGAAVGNLLKLICYPTTHAKPQI